MQKIDLTKGLIPVCTVIAVIVLVLEFLIRQDLIREAEKLQEVIQNGSRQEKGSGNSTARKPARHTAGNDLGVVVGNTGLETPNGSGPVEAPEGHDS